MVIDAIGIFFYDNIEVAVSWERGFTNGKIFVVKEVFNFNFHNPIFQEVGFKIEKFLKLL